MAICVECEEHYSDERANLGYRLCVACSSSYDNIRKDVYKGQLAQQYNKGPYQLLTSGLDLKSLDRKV